MAFKSCLQNGFKDEKKIGNGQIFVRLVEYKKG